MENDREKMRQAVLFNKPHDVLLAVAAELERMQRVREENCREMIRQRNQLGDEKRDEWKRAEKAEGKAIVWMVLAIVGWVTLVGTIIAQHMK